MRYQPSRYSLRKFILACLILLAKSACLFAQSGNWELSHSQGVVMGISSIEFSPDSKFLATGSVNGGLKVWGVNSQRVVHDISAHENKITDLQFTIDGNSLVTSSLDGKVKIWDMSSGDLIRTIECYDEGVKRIELSPDNSIVLLTVPSMSAYDVVKFWNLKTGDFMGNLAIDVLSDATFFGPRFNNVYQQSSDGVEYLDMLGEKEDTLLFKRPREHSTLFTLSPDKKQIAIIDQYFPLPTLQDRLLGIPIIDEDSLGEDYLPKDEIASYRDLLKFKGFIVPDDPSVDANNRPVKVVVRNDATQNLAIVDEHLPVEIVNLSDGSHKVTNIRKIYDAAISYDNKKMISIDEDGESVKLWDLEKGDLEFEFTGHGGLTDDIIQEPSTIFLFSPNERHIFLSSDEGGIEIWDVISHEMVLDVLSWVKDKSKATNYIDGLHKVDDAVFNHDGNLLAFTSYDRIYVVDLRSLEVILYKNRAISLKTAILSPSGRWLLTSSNLSKSHLWNLDDLSHQDLKIISSSNIQSEVFSPKDDILAMNIGINSCEIWNLNSGEKFKLEGHSDVIIHLEFDKMGSKLLTTSWDGMAKIWDAKSGKLITDLEGHIDKVVSGEFSPSGKLVLTLGMDGAANIWDVESGEIMLTKRAYPQFELAHFSLDGDDLLTAEQGSNELNLWKVDGGSFFKRFSGHKKPITAAVFHPDQESIISAARDSTVKKWSKHTGVELKSIQMDDGYIEEIKLSPGGDQFATISYQGKVKIWDSYTFELLHSLKGHKDNIKSIGFSNDGQTVITSSGDGKVIMWNKSTGEQLITLNDLQDAYYESTILDKPYEFLWVEEEGKYYYSSTSSAEDLYFTKGIQTLSFNQLDVRYNRPDKVLRALKSRDTILLQAYKEAYLMRIEKLGIDTTVFQNQFMVPESSVMNASEIDYAQTEDELTLDLHFEDSVSHLNRMNVLINGVPVFGSRGIDLSPRRLNDFDTTITVSLSYGNNQIEPIVVNSLGIESYHSSLGTNFSAANDIPPKVYFVGLGIDKFKESENDLSYSVKDIQDLAKAFKEKYGELCVIDTLLNQSIGIESIRQIKTKLLETSVNDKVIVAYSGHGLLSENMNYFLSMFDTRFQTPEDGGLPYQELENLLDGIPSRQKLLLVDACHSGEINPEEMERINKTISENEDLVRGMKKGVTDPNESGLDLMSTFSLMQHLFVNVSNDIGATVISAAGGDQFAIEKDGNGVFTSAILDYMKSKSTFTVGQLKSYVSIRVEEMTDGLQQPTSRLENLVYDWVIWE